MNILTPSTSTNRPTSEHVLHPKAFQSWRWVFLAAILLAAVAITTFYFSSAQAQNADGAIAGLTLTSTTAGTLTVSWDAASPPPTDYRVDWAKSTEDYQSWKVDDGHVYPTPDATTTTITDLATIPSTRSACVLATTEANTKANPGAAHGPLPPSP